MHIIASARMSLEAARKAAAEKGFKAVILSDRIEGEAADAGHILAALAYECVEQGEPFAPPIILLSGGETSVTVKGAGRGGRNTEFALGAAMTLDGVDSIIGIAADTDGIDGTENNAGAFFTGECCALMRKAGINPAASLARNDAFTAFEAIDHLLITGPTGVNVNDFRAFLITGR
jgi:hydroxypyruvate reductase